MTQIWAHRGASGQAPENTLESFYRAVELGADGVELDVQMTADNYLVVIHDATIDRTSDGTGLVAEMTLDELRQYSYANHMDGFGRVELPTLRQVYDLLRPTGLRINVELKNAPVPHPGMGRAVEALTTIMNMVGQVTYSSFNHTSLRELVVEGTQQPIGVLLRDPLWQPWEYAERLGAQALHPHWLLTELDPDYIARAHDAGLAVNVWTVNDPAQVERLRRLGADAIMQDL